jgi:hypothetical protein
MGSHLAVPLTSGGGLLSGVELKEGGQEPTLGSKVGLPLESSHDPRRPRSAACSQKLTSMLLLTYSQPIAVS